MRLLVVIGSAAVLLLLNAVSRIGMAMNVDQYTLRDIAVQDRQNADKELCFRPRPINLNDLPERLPKPYIHLGMPKTGTTSLEMFFQCGKVRTSHSICKVTGDLKQKVFNEITRMNGIDQKTGECFSNRVKPPCMLCSRCMYSAKNYSLPMLESCGDYDAFIQMDNGGLESCHFPQLRSLDLIHNEAPSATFLYMFRSMDSWINSIKKFRDGSMLRALGKCSRRKMLPFLNGTQPQHLRGFFCESVMHARNFVAKHPSHKLVEIDLDDPNTGKVLSHLFNIDESCWGETNVNTELHPSNSTTNISIQ
jgi:hypothetical protein